MVAIADIMSAAAATVATVFGQAVTHTAADGTATAIAAATFAADPPATEEVRDGRATVRRATCTIPAASVAAPVRGETITVAADSSVWTIVTAPAAVGGGDYWQLDLKRTEHAERTREGHRIPR